MQNNVFIGIDLGTSGCRAIAIDANKDIIEETRTTYPSSNKAKEGQSEQSPNDWWQAVVQVIQSFSSETKSRAKCLAVDGTSGTLLLCDNFGVPKSQGLMYDDSRAIKQASRLKNLAPASAAVHSPTSALAKLMYLTENNQLNNASHALHQADWINGNFLQRFGISDENNALKMGYDPVQRCWPSWLENIGINPSLLPHVFPVGHDLGVIDKSVARDLQLPESLHIIAGTTDSNAATIAAGVSKVGEAVTSLGSTLVLKMLSDKPISAPEYGVYSHRINDLWLVGGASNTGGAVLKKLFSDTEITHYSQHLKPNTLSRLNYYPLITPGERFPINDADKTPVLTPRPKSRQAFFQACLEGIAEIENQGYRLLHELGAPAVSHIFSSGGGAQNSKWQKMRCHISNTNITVANQTEAAYGCALLASRFNP